MWEETCVVGTPSGYGCFVHQLAPQSPGSENDPFKVSPNGKIQEEITQRICKTGKLTRLLEVTLEIVESQKTWKLCYMKHEVHKL